MKAPFSTGRYVTILDGPVNTDPPPGHPTNGFRWLQQYMLVDQVPETIRDEDTPFRIRMYDTQPRKAKDLLSYRSSLSIGDNLGIGVFPSLDILFDTVYEWRPRPPPNCKELLKNAGFMLTVSSDGRRWIFNVSEETELLTLLDLFRTIAPTSCASADARVQKLDNAELLSPSEAEAYADQLPTSSDNVAASPVHDGDTSFPSQTPALATSPLAHANTHADAFPRSSSPSRNALHSITTDAFSDDIPVRGRSGAQSLSLRAPPASTSITTTTSAAEPVKHLSTGPAAAAASATALLPPSASSSSLAALTADVPVSRTRAQSMFVSTSDATSPPPSQPASPSQSVASPPSLPSLSQLALPAVEEATDIIGSPALAVTSSLAPSAALSSLPASHLGAATVAADVAGSPLLRGQTVRAGDSLSAAPALEPLQSLDALFNKPGERAAPTPTYVAGRGSVAVALGSSSPTADAPRLSTPAHVTPARTPARPSVPELGTIVEADDAAPRVGLVAASASVDAVEGNPPSGSAPSHRFVGQLPPRRRQDSQQQPLRQSSVSPAAALNLPDPGLPLAVSPAAATPTSTSSSSNEYKAQVFQRTFALPDTEELKYDFSCSLSKTILLHGRLYLSTNYACFFSSIFGYKTSLIIPLAAITAIKKDKVASVFPGAIHVTVDNTNNAYAPPPVKGKPAAPSTTFVFASFMRRDPVIAAFKQLAPHAFTAPAEPPTPVAGPADSTTAPPEVAVGAPAGAAKRGAAAANKGKSASTRTRPVLPSSLGVSVLPPAADPVTLADVEMAQVVDTTLNCSAQQVWRIFFLDGAPRSFAMYHADVIKDRDVRITSWLPVPSPATVTAPPAAKHNALMLMPKTEEYVRREFVIDIPLNSPIGPERVKLYKCQHAGRVAVPAGVRITLNNTSTTPEAPFGECFYVVERWEIEDIAGGKCSVRMHTGVCITQRPWKMRPFIGTLTSRAKEDSGKQYTAWAAWASAELQKVLREAGEAHESSFSLEFKVEGDADDTDEAFPDDDSCFLAVSSDIVTDTVITSTGVPIGSLSAPAIPETIDVVGNQVPLLAVVAGVAALVSAILIATTYSLGSGSQSLIISVLFILVCVLTTHSMQLSSRLDVIEKRLTGDN